MDHQINWKYVFHQWPISCIGAIIASPKMIPYFTETGCTANHLFCLFHSVWHNGTHFPLEHFSSDESEQFSSLNRFCLDVGFAIIVRYNDVPFHRTLNKAFKQSLLTKNIKSVSISENKQQPSPMLSYTFKLWIAVPQGFGARGKHKAMLIKVEMKATTAESSWWDH